ncbi:MAG: endonuclease [Verrucomicrobia bacterium]|nr:MAG: endonuclease [Verrucomicrobiota bacterium]
MPKYCYVYVLHSLADDQFYVGLTRDLPARLQAHNKGLVTSTKKRMPDREGKTIHQNEVTKVSHGVKRKPAAARRSDATRARL